MNTLKRFLLLSITLTLLSCSEFEDNESDDLYGSCSLVEANTQLFELMQEKYFWNKELPKSFNPSAYRSLSEALYNLRNEKDHFSFEMTYEEYEDYANSVFFGYGFGHQVTGDETGLKISYVFDEGSAAQNGLRRGDIITKIGDALVSDLIAQINAGTTTWTEQFGPNEDGYTVTVTFEKPDGTEVVADFAKGSIAANTVMATETKELIIGGEDKKVAYMVFDSFKESSQDEFNTAFNKFKTDGVDEMILDLRYNGGGVITTANQLSTQIAGDNVEGELFVSFNYNENQSNQNSDVYFSLGEGIEQLNLDRLVVLTTEGTCSSSELVINSLSPFIDVTVIGDTTCGKPIGMSPELLCDHVIFAINFQTENAVGFGDYFDGLPADCSVDDVVTGDWGDDSDSMLNEGLHYLANGQCSVAATSSKASKLSSQKQVRKSISIKDSMLRKNAL